MQNDLFLISLSMHTHRFILHALYIGIFKKKEYQIIFKEIVSSVIEL